MIGIISRNAIATIVGAMFDAHHIWLASYQWKYHILGTLLRRLVVKGDYSTTNFGESGTY